MPSHPATAGAIRTLHDLWLRRVGQWQHQIQILPEMEPHQRRWVLTAILEHLNDHLLPYMRLEEGLLQTNGTTDSDLLRLEHFTIGRAIEHLEEVAIAGDAPPHQVQAALARLCTTLRDHLLHEATAYLPRLVSTAPPETSR